MATFILETKDSRPVEPPTGWAGLESRDLLRNARWFTRIRWVVIILLLTGALIQWAWPAIFAVLGIGLPAFPLLVIAALLAATNLTYILILRRYSEQTSRRLLCLNLWLQILFDLLALTCLVHMMGCISPFISQAYLFHIVLACIFFSPPFSLLVTLLSSMLLTSVVTLEATGVLPPCRMGSGLATPASTVMASLLYALTGIIFWLAVWYLVSFIAQALRKRDRQLAEANRRLILADEENNRQVLRTTHDLKAPFSGIESNILLLRTAHWDALPEEVRAIIERIETRSSALRERIKDILILGAIKSQDPEDTIDVEPVDLSALVADILKETEDKARHRSVTIAVSGECPPVTTSPRHLSTLLSNLIANAIFYSHEGGHVEITLRQGSEDTSIVSIRDHGIGIRHDALPHIFDEYYRTREAAQHNEMSTGLGLAIVKRIASRLSATISVESECDKGTMFEVVIPNLSALP